MPTVTYLGDDSNKAVQSWVNLMTKESIDFPINVPVNVDPDAPENKDRQALVKHIVAKLSKIESPYFKLDMGRPEAEAPKIDGRTKEGRALKAAES